MIARSGNMQIAPIAPVKVIRGRPPPPLAPLIEDEEDEDESSSCPSGATATSTVPRTGWRIIEGSDTERKRDIVAYGHPRTQGTDRPAARAARSVSVLQRGWRHDLRRQGARAARPA